MATNIHRQRELLLDLRMDLDDPAESLMDLLKKISEVAQNLDLKDLSQWCHQELNGYGKDEPPSYRWIEGNVSVSISNVVRNYGGPYGVYSKRVPIRDGLTQIEGKLTPVSMFGRPSNDGQHVILLDIPNEVVDAFKKDLELVLFVKAEELKLVVGEIRRQALKKINALIVAAEKTLTPEIDKSYCGFVQTNDGWEITFKGNGPIPFRKKQGLLYIWEIIRGGGKEVSAMDIYQAYVTMGDAVLASPGDTVQIADLDRKQQGLKIEMIDIENELSEAEDNNDSATISRLKALKEFYAKQVLVIHNTKIRLAKSNPFMEKARKTIGNGIVSGIEIISKSMPELAEHFRKNIRTGFQLKYNGELRWDTRSRDLKR